ncbi:hypothetical protein CBS101457_004370 [Exobasidium rhododendri]|nr:hypothetical protein CBS101457_004370 [Exobasidium rhododendri]
MAPASPLLFKRECYYDNFGNENCGGFSNGARIGVGIGIAVAIIVIILFIGLLGKRRRSRNASNIQPIYTTQPTQGYNQGYNTQGGNNAAYSPYGTAPQQEQQNYYGGNQGYGYPPAGGESYGPPSGAPPQEDHYAAPPMPPPTYQKEGEK